MQTDPNIEGSTVLVVDDSLPNLSLLRDALENHGFRMMAARDGETALETVNHQLPDLILMDVMMPGINGFESCRRLQENISTRDIPVIFLTAKNELANLVEGFKSGRVDYIVKPFHIEEVLARINTHLTLASLKRELQKSHDDTERRVTERIAELTTACEDCEQVKNLESYVEEKTAELASASKSLTEENGKRRILEATRLELLQRLVHTQEHERSRIASELHDGIGQNLMIMINRTDLKQPGARGDAAASERLSELRGFLKQTIQDVRDISYNLRPFLLEKIGLTKSLNAMAVSLAKTTSIRLDVELDEIDGILDRDVEVQIYRIIQECLNNVFKHSRASTTRCTVRKEPCCVMINVADDGCGLKVNSEDSNLESRSGFGLIGMADRVLLMNGDWNCESVPGKGTSIRIKIPRNTKACSCSLF